MSIPQVALSESTPAGSDQIALGDNRIREYKTQNREIMEVDHTYPSSGQSADAGTHKKCSFIEQANLGTGAVGKTLLGSQTVSGKGELVYTDEDDNDIQLTKNGKAYPSQSTTLADWSAIMNLIYPVGIVVTLGVSTNPATLFGVGTWTAIQGMVIVGKASSGTFNTLDATGGEETHTLITAEIPAHTHPNVTTDGNTSPSDSTVRRLNNGSYGENQAPFGSTGSTGGDGAHNNLQPYVVKYVWQRTA